MPTTSYVTLNGRVSSLAVGVDPSAARPSVGGRIDLLSDALGSVVRTVSDDSINGGETIRYAGYGGVLYEAGGWAQPRVSWVGSLGYRSTQLRHAERYVRARHYASSAGRWTSVDPLWPGEDAYGYVEGNPTNMVDPSGMQSKLDCPPGFVEDAKKSQQEICKKLPSITSPSAVSSLLACAKANMPKSCKKFPIPSDLPGFGTCMESFCRSNLDYSISCAPADDLGHHTDCLRKGTGAYTPGLIRSPLSFLGFVVCPVAYQKDCGPGKPINPTYGTGGSFYEVPGFKPPDGTPPTLTIVIHETMHSCAPVPKDNSGKECDEIFTQVLANCIAKSILGVGKK